MPSIDSFVAKSHSKPFKKKAYRPWTIIENQGDLPTNNGAEQLDSKQVAIGEQLDSKQVAIGEQKNEKKSCFLGTEKTKNEFKRLSGLQKEIVLFVGKICLENDSTNSGGISMKDLQEAIRRDPNTIKNAIHRVVKKGFIERGKSKPGVGGFCTFKISPFLKQLVSEHEKNTIPNQNQLDSKIPTSTSSSNNTLTTREDVSVFEGREESEIDTHRLNPIGFENTHLKQILKLKNLSCEIIQDSIDAFAFDLEENGKAEKIKGSPLAYFMGILRKGIPYTPPENYESPETLAFRRYVENRERQKAAREDLEKRNFELDLDDWIEKQTEEELNKAIDEPRYRDKDSPFRRGALSLYFKKNVWTPPRLKENNPSEG